MKTQIIKNRLLAPAALIFLLASNLVPSISQADTLLGSDIEVGLWSPSYNAGSLIGNTSGDNTSVFASATIEHPIPLIPNLKLSISEVNNDVYKYTKIDYTAYYEMLDNDLVSIDLGLGISQFTDASYLAQSFSGVIPHVYADAEIALPFLNTTLYTDIRYINFDDSQIIDAIAGLRYDINLVAVDLGFKAGYRTQIFDTEDFNNLSFDVKTDGLFIGLQADF